MGAKEFLKHGKNIRIEPSGFPQRFGARVRFESGVPNRQRERSRGETGFAQALARFLRKMAEHRGQGVRDAQRSEEHTSELQSPDHILCRLLLEKKRYVGARSSET